MDLALNNLQMLICHKTPTNQLTFLKIYKYEKRLGILRMIKFIVELFAKVKPLGFLH